MSTGIHKLMVTMTVCLAGNLLTTLPSAAQNLISDSGFETGNTGVWPTVSP